MGYREEAIACVSGYVLPYQQALYRQYGGDFDRIYSEAFRSDAYPVR